MRPPLPAPAFALAYPGHRTVRRPPLSYSATTTHCSSAGVRTLCFGDLSEFLECNEWWHFTNTLQVQSQSCEIAYQFSNP